MGQLRKKERCRWNKKQYRWKYMMDKLGILKAKYSVRRRSSNQDWFWTEEWQAGERQVDKDIADGNVQSYDTMKEFIESLHD